MDRGTHGGRIRDRVEQHEVVDRAVAPERRDAHAGLGELAAVGLALVAEDVVLVHDQERGRQPLELLDRRLERRRERPLPLRHVGAVLIPELFHPFLSCAGSAE